MTETVECFELGEMSFWGYVFGIQVFECLVFFGAFLYLGLYPCVYFFWFDFNPDISFLGMYINCVLEQVIGIFGIYLVFDGLYLVYETKEPS